MVNSGKLNESNRRKYQKLLDQFLLLQKRANSGVTSGRDEDEEDEEEKKRKEEEAKIAAKAKAVKVANTKAEERYKKMRTKIRAMHPKPVKKFACAMKAQ